MTCGVGRQGAGVTGPAVPGPPCPHCNYQESEGHAQACPTQMVEMLARILEVLRGRMSMNRTSAERHAAQATLDAQVAAVLSDGRAQAYEVAVQDVLRIAEEHGFG
jgi:hypothetical protein